MKLNKYIDHTLLKPDAQQEQIEKLIEEAREYDFAVSVSTQLGSALQQKGLREIQILKFIPLLDSHWSKYACCPSI